MNLLKKSQITLRSCLLALCFDPTTLNGIAVFKLWREHGLTLGLKKSRLNLRAVKFFGKVFSSEGISPGPDKVAALKAAGPPQSAAEVRPRTMPRHIRDFFALCGAKFESQLRKCTENSKRNRPKLGRSARKFFLCGITI